MGDYGTVLDLETAMAGIADIGATGIEILGEGHIPNYPDPSQEWVDDWFRLLEKYGLEPTNYGSWIDTRLHSGPNGRMTVDEGAAALQRDLRLAKRLGFRFVRPKIGVVSERPGPAPDLDRGRRTLPCPGRRARRHHLPRDPLAHPDQARGRRRVHRVHQADRHQALRHPHRHRHLPGPADPAARRGDARPRPAFLDGIGVDPADFADIAEHVVFIQAKFHDIDENLEDQQIPWEPVLRAIKDAGYTGYLSSEYEGERKPWRSIEQVRRQHSLMRQVADAL